MEFNIAEFECICDKFQPSTSSDTHNGVIELVAFVEQALEDLVDYVLGMDRITHWRPRTK